MADTVTDDPAYLDGPYFYVAMPVNENGHGPEMDEAKAKYVQHEVWNAHNLSVASACNETVARVIADALSRRTAPAEPVAWRKPEHPAATEPFFIDAKLRTEEWMMGVFTVPLYAAPPASPPVSDKMVHAAIAAQQSAKAAYDGPFEAMRAALLAALGGHHD